MENSEQHLTTSELQKEFMLFIVNDTHRWARKLAPAVREAALDDNLNRLVDILDEVRGGAIDLIFALIDGRARPVGWPHIRLVNSETDEDMSVDLAAALASAEDEYLETLDSDPGSN